MKGIIIYLLIVLAMNPATFSRELTPVSHKYLNGESALNIPFEMLEGHIVVPVRINDSRELKFTLDSGIPFHGIDLFHKELSKEFIPASRKVNFSLPGITYHDQKINSIANQYLEKALEDGVIGLTVFGTSVVEIDFDQSIVNLYDPSVYNVGKDMVALDIHFLKGPPIPYIKGAISIDGKTAIEGFFAIDLGSAGKCTILPDSQNRIVPPKAISEAVIGAAASGEIKGGLGRIDYIKIGSLQLNNVMGAFMKERRFAKRNDEVLGFLGTGLLKQFNMVFDYSRKKLYLKHNNHFNEPQ